MNCAKIKKMLSAYIDGDLDSRKTGIIKEHLKKCMQCREDFASLKSIVFELRSMERLDAPDDFIKNVNKRIKTPSLPQKLVDILSFPFRSRIPAELTALAGAALLVFFIFHFTWPFHEVMDISKGTAGSNGNQSLQTNRTETATLAEEKVPVQLTLLLRTVNRHRPLPSKNILPVTSGSRKTNEFGTGPLGKNQELWGVDETMEDVSRSLFKENVHTGQQRDFIIEIKKILSRFEGRLLSKDYEDETETLQYITLAIPAVHYGAFISRLNQIGSLKTAAPELPAGRHHEIQIRIRIIS